MPIRAGSAQCIKSASLFDANLCTDNYWEAKQATKAALLNKQPKKTTLATHLESLVLNSIAFFTMWIPKRFDVTFQLSKEKPPKARV